MSARSVVGGLVERCVECFGRLVAPAAHEVGRGPLLGKRVRLAGPEVDRLGVASLARGRAQRRGQVMEMGISGRTIRMIGEKAIDDPAPAAACERPRRAVGLEPSSADR